MAAATRRKKRLRTVGRTPVTEILRNFGTVLVRVLDFKAFGLSIGVKVRITSSVYGYTKVLAHNLNSKKTSGDTIG